MNNPRLIFLWMLCYDLWAFYLHAALLYQAFAHCGKFPTELIRSGSIGFISIGVLLIFPCVRFVSFKRSNINSCWVIKHTSNFPGRDRGLAQFREVLAQVGLAEMGPSNQRFTWRGLTSQFQLDWFLCSTELLALFPLAEVTSLPRALSDHTPVSWSTQVGPGRPTYFKMDRSWLRDGGLKRDSRVVAITPQFPLGLRPAYH